VAIAPTDPPLEFRSPTIDRITAPLSNGVGTEIAELRAAIAKLSEEVAELREQVERDD
jgi:hypothetical protein